VRNELLTVDDVARILGFHPRTVRRYIREGRLKAKKLGKQWRILQEDLNVLTGQDTGVEKSRNDRAADKVHVSAVVDVGVTDEQEASRIFNSMLAAVTGKGSEYGVVQYQTLYLGDEQKARLMFWGDAAFIGEALITLHRISSISE
jgi:excisionase family DNA binding protein